MLTVTSVAVCVGLKTVAAVAVGACVLGDKEDPEKTALLNEGHVVDLAELEGDDERGGDCLYEIKVPSPTIASYSAGRPLPSRATSVVCPTMKAEMAPERVPIRSATADSAPCGPACSPRARRNHEVSRRL